MKQTILVVEDEPVLREIVKDYFLNEHYRVLEAADGQQALKLFQDNEVDLIILDIMLPELDGWSVCRRIRKISDVPIVMLTARIEEDDTLLGFELGADDYVAKPYSPPVLLARAKRLLESRSRLSTQPDIGDTLLLQGVQLNYSSRTVTVDGMPAGLTHTEFEILGYLMQNRGMVVTREQMITKIWGYEYIGDDRTLNTHIRNLRTKLGARSRLITTVIRVGYMFEDAL